MGLSKTLESGMDDARNGVSPQPVLKKTAGRLRGWTCALVLILQLANSVDLNKRPNLLSAELLSFQLGVMTPALLPHRVGRTT